MIFAEPTPFEEALDSRRVKAVLPTTASSWQLQQLAPALRERAMFSARVGNARLLQNLSGMIDQMVSPETVIDFETQKPRPAQPGEYMDAATFRLKMTEALKAMDYQPAKGERGTIKDLFSSARQNLILDTQTKMAHGYGYWAQGQDQAVLNAYPAQELFRAEVRQEKRDWKSRWQNSGGTVYGGRRMIAKKNDPIWTMISSFGLPYAPFDFNSGMDVRDVGRKDALALGVIEEDQQIAPESREFNADLQATGPQRESALFDALMDSLPGRVKLVEGVLHMAT